MGSEMRDVFVAFGELLAKIGERNQHEQEFIKSEYQKIYDKYYYPTQAMEVDDELEVPENIVSFLNILLVISFHI